MLHSTLKSNRASLVGIFAIHLFYTISMLSRSCCQRQITEASHIEDRVITSIDLRGPIFPLRASTHFPCIVSPSTYREPNCQPLAPLSPSSRVYALSPGIHTYLFLNTLAAPLIFYQLA